MLALNYVRVFLNGACDGRSRVTQSQTRPTVAEPPHTTNRQKSSQALVCARQSTIDNQHQFAFSEQKVGRRPALHADTASLRMAREHLVMQKRGVLPYHTTDRFMERACSHKTKRLVRTRMLGVVGGVRSNAAPIPIALLFCCVCSVVVDSIPEDLLVHRNQYRQGPSRPTVPTLA